MGVLTQLPIGDGIRHHFLMKEMDRVDDIIKRMTADLYQKGLSMMKASAGEISLPQVQFLNHLMLALSSFRSAYAEEMEKTIDKVDGVMRARLEQLSTILYESTQGLLKESEIERRLETYGALAQAYLTMSGSQPVVTGVHPLCITPPKKREAILIQCTGFFPKASHPSMTPVLKLKEKELQPVRNIGLLEFAIPFEELFVDGQEELRTAEFSLRVPHTNTGEDKAADAIFQGWLTLLPFSPGKIFLEYTEIEEKVLEETRGSHFWQDSRSVKAGGCGYSLIDQPYILYAGEGWTLKPGSSKVVTTTVQGNATAYLRSEGSAAAVFLVTTHHTKVNGFYGRIECHISAIATRTLTTSKKKVEQLPLLWGDSFQIDPAKHKNWRVVFEAFTGLQKYYSGNVEDSFISIQAPGGNPRITMQVPTRGSSLVRPNIEGVQAKL